jgi:hypothetical protein
VRDHLAELGIAAVTGLNAGAVTRFKITRTGQQGCKQVPRIAA